MKKRFKSVQQSYRNKANLKYKIAFIGGFFVILTLLSLVYASNYGWLVFKGTVARTQNMDIRFVNAEFLGLPRAGESVAVSSADDYKTIRLSLQLMMPGDSRAVQFQIQNIGNQAVRLVNIKTSFDSARPDGLIIEFPDEIAESANLKNYVLVSSETSDKFLIYVTWDANAVNLDTGDFHDFTLTFDYENAMLVMEE